MAKEPNDVVVRILREIQTAVADHGRMLEQHTRYFEKLDIGQQEIRGSIVTAPWLSAHANVRNDLMEDRLEKLESAYGEIDELKARVKRLESHEA
jgi:hypothetical protein